MPLILSGITSEMKRQNEGCIASVGHSQHFECWGGKISLHVFVTAVFILLFFSCDPTLHILRQVSLDLKELLSHRYTHDVQWAGNDIYLLFHVWKSHNIWLLHFLRLISASLYLISKPWGAFLLAVYKIWEICDTSYPQLYYFNDGSEFQRVNDLQQQNFYLYKMSLIIHQSNYRVSSCFTVPYFHRYDINLTLVLTLVQS